MEENTTWEKLFELQSNSENINLKIDLLKDDLLPDDQISIMKNGY